MLFAIAHPAREFGDGVLLIAAGTVADADTEAHLFNVAARENDRRRCLNCAGEWSGADGQPPQSECLFINRHAIFEVLK